MRFRGQLLEGGEDTAVQQVFAVIELQAGGLEQEVTGPARVVGKQLFEGGLPQARGQSLQLFPGRQVVQEFARGHAQWSRLIDRSVIFAIADRASPAGRRCRHSSARS